jgi:hypothetical protein
LGFKTTTLTQPKKTLFWPSIKNKNKKNKEENPATPKFF